MDFKTLNPYGLLEGQQCDTIRIRRLPLVGLAQQEAAEDVVVAIPVDQFETMQDVATAAFLYAKEQGQLTAALMLVCEFSYRDDDQDAWIVFDPADY